MSTFGQAIIELEKGCKVARIGWNGKNMFLFLVRPEDYFFWNNPLSNIDIDRYEKAPWIGMKTVDNKIIPWFPSQADILATDYIFVP